MDRDAEPGYGDDAGLMWLRTPVGVASGQAPLLPGRGGRFGMRRTRQGAAELHLDAGGRTSGRRALVIPFQ
jgi:hypothetical protein